MAKTIFPFFLDVPLLDKNKKEIAVFSISGEAAIFPGDEPSVDFNYIRHKGIDLFPLFDSCWMFDEIMEYINEKCTEYVINTHRAAAMPQFNRDNHD